MNKLPLISGLPRVSLKMLQLALKIIQIKNTEGGGGGVFVILICSGFVSLTTISRGTHEMFRASHVVAREKNMADKKAKASTSVAAFTPPKW